MTRQELLDHVTQAQQIAREHDAFMGRLLNSAQGVVDIFAIHIGNQLGLYRALADGGWRTSTELAAEADAHERYVREWLEQQAVTGILEVENEGVEPRARRFCLPAGHAAALTERDSPHCMMPMVQCTVAVTRPLTALLEAYRTGGGVPLAEYGDLFREAQADFNRVAFLGQLGSEWLPAIADVHARLQADPPARVADIGCGAGWSSIGIAQAYPKVQVDGYDLDQPFMETARANARQAGLTGRVNFHVRDASDPALVGRYDLVIAFECVHDMANPVGALRVMRRLAGESGTVLVVDERVGDAFSVDGNGEDGLYYGFSILHCLAVGMAQQPSAGTGTLMRIGTLRRYATEAGFRDVEILPIDSGLLRFYRLMG
jgi:hypothetical protein